MRFVVLGLSHKTAPLALRERFALSNEELSETLTKLVRLDNVNEACVISTCNRVEIYAAGSARPEQIGKSLRGYLQIYSGYSADQLRPHLYQHEGVEALRHLFRVASSLDSMVLGEPQVLGQVKSAYREAINVESAGPTISRSFERAFSVAKRVRGETGIAEHAVSMSFAAVELGREIFDSLEGKQVLLIGAGKMASLAAQHLKAHGVEVRVANRSLETAEKLAKSIGGYASSLSDLPMLLRQADIVISSTAAPGFVVEKKMMAKVIRERRYRSILFVDIAVPRDIHPGVGKLDNVYVYDIDDLKHVLELNRESRMREAEAALRLIDEEVGAFIRWSKSQQVVPVIKALRTQVVQLAEQEVERTLAHLDPADPQTEKRIRSMGQAIVNKVLHPVLIRLKEEGAHGDPQVLIDALVSLFELSLSASSEQKPADAEENSNVVPFRQKEHGKAKG